MAIYLFAFINGVLMRFLYFKIKKDTRMNSPLGTPSPTGGHTASGGPATRSKSRSLLRDITPEAVLGMRQKARGGREFRVKLVGRDNRSNRWMAERLVPKELVQAYLDSQPAKTSAMSSSTSSSPATTTPSPTTSTKAATKAANKVSAQSPRMTLTPLSSPATIETTTTTTTTTTSTTATAASPAPTLSPGSGGLGRKSLKRKRVVTEAGHGHQREEDSSSQQPRELAAHQYRVLEEVFEIEAGDMEPQLLPGVPLVAYPPRPFVYATSLHCCVLCVVSLVVSCRVVCD
jgi:hypothetical protein